MPLGTKQTKYSPTRRAIGVLFCCFLSGCHTVRSEAKFGRIGEHR